MLHSGEVPARSRKRNPLKADIVFTGGCPVGPGPATDRRRRRHRVILGVGRHPPRLMAEGQTLTRPGCDRLTARNREAAPRGTFAGPEGGGMLSDSRCSRLNGADVNARDFPRQARPPQCANETMARGRA